MNPPDLGLMWEGKTLTLQAAMPRKLKSTPHFKVPLKSHPLQVWGVHADLT